MYRVRSPSRSPLALGDFGGEAFRDSTWKPLLLSLEIAAAVAAGGEAARRLGLRGDGRDDRREAERIVRR